MLVFLLNKIFLYSHIRIYTVEAVLLLYCDIEIKRLFFSICQPQTKDCIGNLTPYQQMICVRKTLLC